MSVPTCFLYHSCMTNSIYHSMNHFCNEIINGPLPYLRQRDVTNRCDQNELENDKMIYGRYPWSYHIMSINKYPLILGSYGLTFTNNSTVYDSNSIALQKNYRSTKKIISYLP